MIMDKKLLIFLLGFFIFLGLWQKLVVERWAKSPAAIHKIEEERKPASPPAATPPTQVTPNHVEVQTAPSVATPEASIRLAVVDTTLYHAEFSNQGGLLTSFQLKKYKDDFGNPLEMIPESTEMNRLPLSLDLEDSKVTVIASKGVYTIDHDRILLTGNQTGALALTFSDGQHSFRKSFQFRGDSYIIESTFEAKDGESNIPLRVSWSPGLESLKSLKVTTEAVPSRALVENGDKVSRFQSKDAEEFKKIGSTIRWAGVETNYFCTIMIPRNQPADAYIRQVKQGEKKLVHNINVLVAGQQPQPLQLSLFVGPKDYRLLKGMGLSLEKAIDFGFFSPIAIPLFYGLNWFYKYTKNYGWAIVLLTILIKILFTPFVQKSFSSMKKMQTMQPELKLVQDKYAKMKNDDPRKASMNTEIMQLHKRYGINPLGGCLPMLMQMPVLFAFYMLLANTIELRKAPFIWWLQDLSRPDPYWITPILMGVTMLIQQRMTPATDPMQKNMMLIMPVMFTFMSFKFASGLVVYWLLSNVLAIAHQYYFQQRQKKAAAEKALATT
jgi:YidC/Oxa1 family membrane protein insertase